LLNIDFLKILRRKNFLFVPYIKNKTSKQALPGLSGSIASFMPVFLKINSFYYSRGYSVF